MSAATAKPIGWVNEAGILFPLASYNPERTNYLDDHKKGWKRVFHEDTVAELQQARAAIAKATGGAA